VIRNKFSLLMLVLFSLVNCCSVSWAADTELQTGKMRDGTLIAPNTDSYSLTLKAGDLAETNIVTHGTKLIITVYGPAARCVVSDSTAQAGIFSSSPMIQVDTGSKWLLTQRSKKDHTQSGSQGSSPLQIELPRRLRSDMKAHALRHSEPVSKTTKRTQLKTSGKR